ncbi:MULTISPECIES: ureidoglycolate lyase [unclassified Sulfitobacter]|uniref:ureidoglycolate lyase n=3 Tax=Sulfitobacter TaxID=60136 RepID=UPI0007C2CB41|nr:MULTISPECIES: ureidoglycolate lyase [unclassified Sulfitobacter]KZY06476.1 Ureidoglycolate hydrolase [Sulfitobacter sp. HI0023]KZZ69393.1 Ureidoglycolate hydrolase [Sulfitobacter sp. HI0129]
MTKPLKTRPLTREAFAPYGNLLDASGTPDKMINRGKCARFHDRAQLDFNDGRAGISIFRGERETLPYTLEMMERHPEGSQAFIPMSADPFLVIVAADKDGAPVDPQAFVTAPGEGVNFHKGTWHGVLTPLAEPGLFAVIDRIGEGANLEEHWFEEPYIIEDGRG